MAVIRSFLSAVAVLTLCAVVLAEDSDVVKLTKDNFADVIAKEKLVFVKFFAPWCGHCQSMAEDFKIVATELKGKAVLGDLDATVEEDIAKRYNIEGFPTLKLFSNGEELTDYNGGRDKDSMIKFIERATLPPFHNIDDSAAYKKFLNDNKDKSILVSYAMDAAQLASFKKASFALRDTMPDSVDFAVVKDQSDVGIASFSKGDVYLLRLESDGTRTPLKYDPEVSASIDKFVKSAALPVWQEFTQENAELYTELSKPLVVGFYKDCEGSKCQTLEALAKKKASSGKVAFAWVNSETLASFQEYVGLKDAEDPICAYSFESDARYILPEGFKFSEESLEAWIDDLIAGKLTAARKSQPIPESNEGPVYTVVGDSWTDVVEDTEKDVVIAQVAEWCGHCNRLKPIYKKVAEELKKAGIDHVKLALMDATENDAPAGFKAKGFPTIHFFPAGEKQEGIECDFDRSSKGIIEWIQNKTTKKFEFDTSTLGEDPEPAEDGGEPEPEGEGEGEGGEEDEGEYEGEGEDEGEGGAEEEHEGEEKEEL